LPLPFSMISKKCLACWILQSSSSCGSKERLELRRIRTDPWIRIESQNNPSEQDNESKILTPGIRYMNSLKILTKQTNCESKCWFVIIMPSKWPSNQIKLNGYQTVLFFRFHLKLCNALIISYSISRSISAFK
jgi:hypothetical protein